MPHAVLEATVGWDCYITTMSDVNFILSQPEEKHLDFVTFLNRVEVLRLSRYISRTLSKQEIDFLNTCMPSAKS